MLERLSIATTFLPPGVTPYLAPDATALGQIFWYTVEGDGKDLERAAVDPGLVRPLPAQLRPRRGRGGLGRRCPIEYQIDVDPNKLRAYGVTLGEVYSAVARSNSSVGGRVIQKGNAEYLIRSVGWIENLDDIARRSSPGAATARRSTSASSARCRSGQQFRRSVLEKDGNEAVGGVVLMRYGENPLEVTRRIKEKITSSRPGCPRACGSCRSTTARG